MTDLTYSISSAIVS